MTIDLITNFVMKNKSIIAGVIMAASMGVGGLGLLGCSAGLASGFGAKVLSKKIDLEIPKQDAKLGGRFTSFFEPTYEKVLATAFSTDVTPIQVWQIQKRLKNWAWNTSWLATKQ